MIQNTLDIKASQQLAMTPRLQQAIHLLQMSSIDLNDYVQEQLLENPLLIDDGHSDFSNSRDSPLLDVKKGVDDDYIHNIKESETLKEYVLKQFLPQAQSQTDRFMGQLMIDLLTDDGYFLEDINSFADRFNVKNTDILKLLKKLQECEPVGVFARDLKECFYLQLEDMNLIDHPTEQFLTYLDILPNEGLLGISNASGIDIALCKEILNKLKQLNPKPGLLFESTPVTPIIPDVIVSMCRVKKEFMVELNQDALPKVFLNTSYYQQLQEKCKKGQEIVYLKEKKNHANWLLQSLMQRSTNILKVSKAILDYQKDFFDKGVHNLYPLTLKDIAQKTNLHESTVSRLTTNKYMETPLGVLDFKFFFNSKLSTNKRYKEGDLKKALSSRSVMELIKNHISSELAEEPLSDEDLVILLRQEGVDIARRTVAKYRTHLRIENSSKRKKNLVN